MGDFTITFLGTGTSVGIPVIGCDCAVCSSSDARDRRTRSSIYVETPEAAWVVDTGPDFRAQALREGIRRVNAAVITHAHADHIMGLDDLRPFCFGGKWMPVYAAPATMRDLERVFAFAFNGENRWPGYLRPEPHEISGPFMLGETTLVPLPVPHGRTTTTGFLFERRGEKLAAYLSDCKAVPPEVAERIAGVKTLIIDGLRRTPHPTHLSLDEAVAVAAEVRAGQTWLTHLCHELGHAEASAGLPPGVAVAYDGLRISL